MDFSGVTKQFLLIGMTKRQRVIAEEETANNRTSGKAKLKTGEALTDAEVEALFG